MWTIFLIIISLFGIITLVALVFLVPYQLAQRNLFWTIVAEGTSKQVLYMDKFTKSLLTKKGYKLDDDWELVDNKVGDKEKASGLCWVGIWPFFKVYERPMEFAKALSNGTYEWRNAPADFMLTGTSYQYSLIFSDAEDKEKLPLSGQMTMTAMITNPYKALFLINDWFDALVTRVLPRVREYISNHTYDKLINDPDVQLDTEVFEMLKRFDLKGPKNGPSIWSVLKNQYGIELLALETVNIDPPSDYREATLRQFNAVQTAKAEAEETGGALDRMINQRINQLAKRLGLDPKTSEVRDYLKANPDILRRFEEQQLDLLRRDRNKGGVRDIRVANADGSNLDSATATLMSLIELWKGGGGGGASSDFGNSGKANNPSDKGNKGKNQGWLNEVEEFLKQKEGGEN